MSQKKNALVALRTKRNAAPAANPPLSFDAVNVLLPGIGAYATTRTVARCVYNVVQKRAPRWAKHAHAVSGLVAFAGVWLLGHRVQRLAKYHDAIVMGSGLAAFQGLAANYLPMKYRWVIADPHPAPPVGMLAPPAMPIALPAPQEADPWSSQLEQLPEDTAGGEYAQLERQLRQLERSGSRKPATAPAPRQARNPIASQLAAADPDDGDDVGAGMLDPDLAAALGSDEGVDDLYTGAFEP